MLTEQHKSLCGADKRRVRIRAISLAGEPWNVALAMTQGQIKPKKVSS